MSCCSFKTCWLISTSPMRPGQDCYDVLLIAHDGSTQAFNNFFKPKDRS